MTPQRTNFRRTALGFLAATTLLVGACGDDDTAIVDTASDDTASVDASAANAAPVAAETGDAQTGDTQTGDTDATLDEVGLGTKAFAIGSATDLETEVVDDKTIKILAPDTTMDDPTLCIVVGAILDADETAIVVFSDGEVNCNEQ